MDIKGKVALVTGAAAAQSIGLAVVEKLLQKGAKGVSIVDVDVGKGEPTVEELNKKYGAGKVIFIECNVGKKSQLEDAFKKTKETFGQIDIVSNNAGIVNERQYEEMITVNLTGVINSTLLGVEFIGTKNGGNGGVVINTSSFAGIFPNSLLPVYAATKHGVVGYTRSVANEPRVLENNVRVAAICPGMVNTLTALKTYPSEANRYVKEITEDLERAPAIEPEAVGDAVATMIEDASYSGTASMIGGGVPLTTIEIPFIDPV